MDNQEWIAVSSRRRTVKKEIESDMKVIKQEKEEIVAPTMRINNECVQQLIRKRIQMKVNQEKADSLCAFPRNTFKNIESNRMIPNEGQKQRIAKVFDISLKIDTLL
jgi:ribosomal protein L13E